jgi:hypothetical protein
MEEVFSCHFCNKYSAKKKNTLLRHLQRTHNKTLIENELQSSSVEGSNEVEIRPCSPPQEETSFDLSNIDFLKNFTIGLFARPRSGKTTLIYSILNHTQTLFSNALLFTGNRDNSDEYVSLGYVRKEYVFSDFDDELSHFALKKLMKMREESRDNRILLIFDDIIGSSGKLHSGGGALNKLITQFAHYNLSIIISIQYANMLSPLARESIQHAFIFKQTSDTSLEAIQQSFFGRQTFLEISTKIDDMTKEPYTSIITFERDNRRFVASYKVSEEEMLTIQSRMPENCPYQGVDNYSYSDFAHLNEMETQQKKDTVIIQKKLDKVRAENFEVVEPDEDVEAPKIVFNAAVDNSEDNFYKTTVLLASLGCSLTSALHNYSHHFPDLSGGFERFIQNERPIRQSIHDMNIEGHLPNMLKSINSKQRFALSVLSPFLPELTQKKTVNPSTQENSLNISQQSSCEQSSQELKPESQVSSEDGGKSSQVDLSSFVGF